MERCQPHNVAVYAEQLRDAEEERGETLFDMIVSIIRDHGASGWESEDGVVLELEE
jgi:hypothetical protein